MFCIEVWDNGQWEELQRTRKASKKELQSEVDDLNRNVSSQVKKQLLVTNRYRIKKVKNEKK